jgi:hypothetical protein
MLDDDRRVKETLADYFDRAEAWADFVARETPEEYAARIAAARKAELASLRVACQRMPVAKTDRDGNVRYMPGLPMRWIEAIEQNQQANSCCRHPENHDIGAFYSSADDEAKGIPDIYIMFCKCGAFHRRLCVGGSDPVTGRGMRPKWEVR